MRFLPACTEHNFEIKWPLKIVSSAFVVEYVCGLTRFRSAVVDKHFVIICSATMESKKKRSTCLEMSLTLIALQVLYEAL